MGYARGHGPGGCQGQVLLVPHVPHFDRAGDAKRQGTELDGYSSLCAAHIQIKC